MLDNYFILNGNRFDLLNNGANLVGELSLSLKFVLGDHTVEEIEELANNLPDILDIYGTANNDLMRQFKGYIELSSITKLVNYPLGDGTSADVIDLVIVRPEEIWFYVKMIKAGKLTINDVPQRLRAEVEKALEY